MKVKMEQSNLLVLFIVITFMSSWQAQSAPPSGKGKNNDTTIDTSSVFTPISMQHEEYFFRYPWSRTNCIGEDDEIHWKAIGDLKPGESFSFTNKVPACKYHNAAISARLNWQGSQLKMESTVTDYNFTIYNADAKGTHIVAPVIGQTSQLCMFPSYNEENTHFTITITNVGTEVAKDVDFSGDSENDWVVYFHNRCLNADADQDGWNDAFEHNMAQRLYGIGYIDGVYQPYILWGSDYLSATAKTAAIDDEIDSYPADFNDDGIVDGTDLSAVNLYLDQGNGVALEEISPNPGDPEYHHSQKAPWRRYDLNGDGYVTEDDASIVNLLIGHTIPMQEDIIPPFSNVKIPAEGQIVPRGNYFRITGHAWDNAGIKKVEYLANGKVICSVDKPLQNLGYTSPFYYCWWDVPNKRGSYNLSIRVEDSSGIIKESKTRVVTVQ